MKKICFKVQMIILLLIILLNSCSKDFLDKNPTDSLSAGTFYTSKNSIDMALTACYSTLQDVIFSANMPAIDCMADNGYCFNVSWYSITNITQGPITPTSGGLVDKVYSYSYSCIARYNIFLKTLGKYSGTDVNAELKSKYEAEARLLRAQKYFDLYKFYGSVPLVTEPVTIENQYQPKVEASKVLAQINSDLDFAISN
ncbi:MAG: RagB/SusD family nutrient uptake outer membrane protein, partial [Paludibacter sp.]|nr:RagB/SusD family nutrient uptake outer membrane protein [Paludibacter sp.]